MIEDGDECPGGGGPASRVMVRKSARELTCLLARVGLFNGWGDTWINKPGSQLLFTGLGVKSALQSVRTLAKVKKIEAAKMKAAIKDKVAGFTSPITREFMGNVVNIERGVQNMFDLWKAENEKHYGAHCLVFPCHTNELRKGAINFAADSRVRVIRPTVLDIAFRVFQSRDNADHDANCYRSAIGEDLVDYGVKLDSVEIFVADTTAVMFCVKKNGRTKIDVKNKDGLVISSAFLDMTPSTTTYVTCFLHEGSLVVKSTRDNNYFEQMVVFVQQLGRWWRVDKRLFSLRVVQKDAGVRFPLIPISGCDHKFFFFLLAVCCCYSARQVDPPRESTPRVVDGEAACHRRWWLLQQGHGSMGT